MSNASLRLKKLIEDLTGQTIPFQEQELPKAAVRLLTSQKSKGLGYSQFNELLLHLGFDRVTHPFFQFIVDQTTEYKSGSSITNIAHLEKGISAFRIVAILFFGNVKFAFKKLSRDSSFLREHLARFSHRSEKSFKARHEQVIPPEAISGDDTYYLGYVVERELSERLQNNPTDNQLLKEEEKRKSIVAQGRRNHDGYLVSDHLDVYIATSMRERHEFSSVHQATRSIFRHQALKKLNVRWFDPTQAYCKDRIDKGLAEGLMLKRAKCTIYFAQESDTFGKDSELASTLAQGKPVIAFVPRPKSDAAERIINSLSKDALSAAQAILHQLRIYEPNAAWEDTKVRKWIENPNTLSRSEGIKRLQNAMLNHFIRRDKMLRDIHPLGIQLNLQTGVANGVLVANTVGQCAQLVRALLLRQMKFELVTETREGYEYTFLKDKITNSIFRVVSGDPFLTNAFWNFYLTPTEEGGHTISIEEPDYKKSKNDPYDLARSGSERPVVPRL